MGSVAIQLYRCVACRNKAGLINECSSWLEKWRISCPTPDCWQGPAKPSRIEAAKAWNAAMDRATVPLAEGRE